MFQVVILNTRLKERDEIIFQGRVASVFLPGRDGEFEVLDFHKPIVSRLKKGVILVDNDREIPIRDGIVKMNKQELVAVVDLV